MRSRRSESPVRDTIRLLAECEKLRRRVADQSAALRQAAIDAEGLEYAIAHDLRTPLRAIASTSCILAEEMGPSLIPEHQALLARQILNAGRSGSLIDALLEYSRLSRAEVRRSPFDVTGAVRSLCPDAEVEPNIWIAADRRLATIALGCLLDNAAKFAPGKRVRVYQAFGVVAVADDGPGFESQHAERIFRPFERLVGEDVPGTGIGLAKVRKILERHEGSAWATSIPEEGASFFVSFEPRSSKSVRRLCQCGRLERP